MDRSPIGERHRALQVRERRAQLRPAKTCNHARNLRYTQLAGRRWWVDGLPTPYRQDHSQAFH